MGENLNIFIRNVKLSEPLLYISGPRISKSMDNLSLEYQTEKGKINGLKCFCFD